MPGRAWPSASPQVITSGAPVVQPHLVIQPIDEAIAPVTSTATFDQVQTWDGVGAEKLSATASFDQTATWAGAGSEKLTAAASFVQTATFDAAVVEKLNSSGAFAQTATWAAQGGQVAPIPAVTGTASFAQQPGSWLAAETEIIVGSASFAQSSTHYSTGKLRIMGYASKVMPQEYANATGTVIEGS